MDTELDALLEALRKNKLSTIQQTQRATIPGLVDRGIARSPISRGIMQDITASGLGDLDAQIANILWQNRQTESGKEFTREGWAEQARQAALGRDYGSLENRASRAASEKLTKAGWAREEKMRAEDRAYYESIADKIAKQAQSQEQNSLLGQLLSAGLGAGAMLIPGMAPAGIAGNLLAKLLSGAGLGLPGVAYSAMTR